MQQHTGDALALQALGNKVTEFGGLETIPANPLLERVVMRSDEVAAVCPVTGQPDWYTVTIDFAPSRYGLESKSLKLYLQSFRNTGIFSEDFACRIAEDVAAVVKPYHGTVTVTQKPRGGVSIDATAAMPEVVEDLDEEEAPLG